MSSEHIRWKQRFDNFQRAFFRLQEAMEKTDLNELERNGLVQRFEFSLELCWKTIKDFLEYEGLDFKPTPKETIREAFKAELVTNARELINALDMRNELSHDYNGDKFSKYEQRFRQETFPAIKAVYDTFKSQLSE